MSANAKFELEKALLTTNPEMCTQVQTITHIEMKEWVSTNFKQSCQSDFKCNTKNSSYLTLKLELEFFYKYSVFSNNDDK